MEARNEIAMVSEPFRREILDSARDLFVNEGYEKFSIHKLADHTGLPLPTINRLFNDKDDLLFAICEDVA